MEHTQDELANMSDDEFLNSMLPTEDSVEEKEEPETTEVTEPEVEATEPEKHEEVVVAEPVKQPEQTVVDEPESEPDKVPVAGSHDVDHKTAYEKIMAPFKANGKMMQVASPEEAISLMQMGANYTRKMQELQPQRKILLMLENSGLLDEGKLSYLIDLDKKEPNAIKKLLKDSNFDPLEVDLEEESTYREGNHRVSDEEANFRSVLDELNSNPVGRDTLQVINSTWDQASKEVLWNDPAVMNAIHSHRENGVYDRIVSEIERMQTFGQIPAGTPFLQAYRQVGDYLNANGGFSGLTGSGVTPSTPVARKAVAPKTATTNPKASAAAVHRGTTSKTNTVNLVGMSDEDFLKMPIPK